MAYQYCKICALSELRTKSRIRCIFWNKWKRHYNWCKEFVECKTIKNNKNEKINKRLDRY